MQHITYPFASQGPPVELAKAEGKWLHTMDGQRILDAGGGAIICNIGHAREEVLNAWVEGQREGYILPPWRSPKRLELCERLLRDWLPAGLSRIQFVCSGSEAIETAAKVALQYHAARGDSVRSQMIVRTPSYHGTTLTAAALSGHPARQVGLEPAMTRYPRVHSPYPLRPPEDMAESEPGSHYLNELEGCIASIGAERVAAFIAEPVVGSSGGILIPPDDYWAGVRRICDANGILLIADEVMTGFGRTGARFAVEHWQVRPDILVSGKGLAGGYAPINGVFARSDIGEAIEEAGMSLMFHTCSALSGPCGAASKVLEIMLRESLIDASRTLGELLLHTLRECLHNDPWVAEVRGKGLLLGVEIVRDRATLEHFAPEAQMTSRICEEAFRRGVFLYPGGTGEVRDILCLGPPFTIDRADILLIAEVLRDSIIAVRESGCTRT